MNDDKISKLWNPSEAVWGKGGHETWILTFGTKCQISTSFIELLYILNDARHSLNNS